MKYTVYKTIDGQHYKWGTWYDSDKANAVALELCSLNPDLDIWVCEEKAAN